MYLLLVPIPIHTLINLCLIPHPFLLLHCPSTHPPGPHYLQDYPDCDFVNMIIHIIHHGANTGYLADHNHSQSCSNLHSATDHPLAIEADIVTQVAAGCTSGPFNGPPLPFFHLSPQGAVTQKHQSKVRRIFHLSWPHESLVNDGIPDTEASISYDMFFKVVEDLRASGIGSLFIKLDLEQAFCQIPVRQENWHLLGLSWADKFYYDLALCFGLHSASYIFNLFAEALHWIIKCHIPGYLWHYLNDFLAIFFSEKSHDTVQKALDWILALGKQLGLHFQPSKVDGPTTVIEFLGIILDSIKMEAHLPDVKLAYLQEQLVLWQSRQDCMLQELYELTRYLQFCSQSFPCPVPSSVRCMTSHHHSHPHLLAVVSPPSSMLTSTGGPMLHCIGTVST